MIKVKLTKNELKKQKDALKRFVRYLPTLQIKKQQLQLEILKIQRLQESMQNSIRTLQSEVDQWIELFSDTIDLTGLVRVERVETAQNNVAGIDIPVFQDVRFREEEYDLVLVPLWVDYGLKAVKDMVTLKIEFIILEKQLSLLREELRITTQRVNLFEKVKIPETRECIRRIQIYLGDVRTAAVVTGKIAKSNIQRKEALQEVVA